MKIQILASDADLVRGALRDEPGAFEELVLRHQRKAQAVALAIGVKPQSVEDVLQGSFLRAFRELSGLQEPASFGSWLLAIVRNEAREHLRSAARGSFEALPEGIESAPGDSLEARDFREFLWRKVGELPEGVREAVFLYYHEGRSVRNVARTLQVSPSAVKNRLMAGRDLLRGRLWTEMARCFEGLLPPRREWRRRGRRLALVAMMAVPGSLPGPAKAAAIESASISSGGFISALFQGVLIMAAKKTAILCGSSPTRTASRSPRSRSSTGATSVWGAPARSSGTGTA
jgi:RNA polymerase sigma-70 factor (ECF subfamily)